MFLVIQIIRNCYAQLMQWWLTKYQIMDGFILDTINATQEWQTLSNAANVKRYMSREEVQCDYEGWGPNFKYKFFSVG